MQGHTTALNTMQVHVSGTSLAGFASSREVKLLMRSGQGRTSGWWYRGIKACS